MTEPCEFVLELSASRCKLRIESPGLQAVTINFSSPLEMLQTKALRPGVCLIKYCADETFWKRVVAVSSGTITIGPPNRMGAPKGWVPTQP